MNSFIKIKRLASSSVRLKNPSGIINIKLKYKKNKLSKILNDLKYIKYQNLDKNSLIDYNDKKFFNKPKTAKRNLRYVNDASSIYDNGNIIPKEINNIKINQKSTKPLWNYSYYFKENNNRIIRHNYSAKKLRIKQLLDLKSPYIIEDWQKPRMIKILEKNSLIEEQVILKPWIFFPIINN